MEFRDLKAQYQALKPQIDAAMAAVAASGEFIMGKPVAELEARLAEYVGVKHAVTCANGTDALSLVLMAWGIGPGDAVFVPDFTFFASGETAALQGATPVFADVGPDTFNLDPVRLEEAVLRVKAEGKLAPKVVVPVDLFGLPADHAAIEAVAKKYGLLVLEDAAQGFGGSINGKRAGSFGDAAATSFFPAKPLGCYGDGGAVFTNDDGLAELLRSIRVHGKGDNKYDNVRIGLNSRLDTLQAAILLVKLKAFTGIELETVNAAADFYTKLLQNVKTPLVPDGFYSSWAQYTIQLKSREQRDMLQATLKEKGIPTMVYYPKPMHRQAAFAAHTYDDADFPVTNRLCDTVLSLPMHPYLNMGDALDVANEINGRLSE